MNAIRLSRNPFVFVCFIQLFIWQVLSFACLWVISIFLIAGSAFAQGTIAISLEPLVDVSALAPDQEFDVNVRLHAEGSDVFSITQFQFDLSQITGASFVAVLWNQEVIGDPTLLSCDFDGIGEDQGSLPDCRYADLSFDNIVSASYLYASYDPFTSPGDAARPPVHLFNGDPEGVIIAALRYRFNPNEETGQMQVCGLPHEFGQTGVLFTSQTTQFFDFTSIPTSYSEYFGNVYGCADSALILEPESENEPVEFPEFDIHGNYTHFSYPMNGSIDPRSPYPVNGVPTTGGFDKVCFRFTTPVSPQNLTPQHFSTVQAYYLSTFPQAEIAPEYNIDPSTFQVPVVTEVVYNPGESVSGFIPGDDGTNIACAMLTPRMNPGTWLVIQVLETKAWFGYLPCDINQTGKCDIQDQNYFFTMALQYVFPTPSIPLHLWQFDIDGNGIFHYKPDYKKLLKLRHLLPEINRRVWEGKSLPPIEVVLDGSIFEE